MAFKSWWCAGLCVVGFLGCADPREAHVERAFEQLLAQSGTTIQLSDGLIQGSASGGTRTFIGIPYAAPPVGELRWKPPADVSPWRGTLHATGPGVTCVQSTAVPALGAPSQREDCLTLNVFAPEPAADGPVPVMVWFHGGNNRAGSANDTLGFGLPLLYDGAGMRAIAPRQVIVVTVNYRLGMLGFLAHPALSAEQGASGNYGLMDQQAALRWVQKNIAAFGGDASNVTVFGESAGATDVGYHLLAKGSEHLFQRAIMESGVFGTKLPTLAEWEAEGQRLAEKKGCAGTDAAALSCLRSQDAFALLPDALPTEPGGVMFVSGNPDAHDYWGANTMGTLATLDGKLISEQPIVSFAAGRYAQVPMIIGSNAHEASFFVGGSSAFTDQAQLTAALERTYGDQAARVAAQYPISRYASVNEAAIEIASDSVFVCSAFTLARLASRHNPVFVYHWTRAAHILGLDSYGATHGVELAWVWNWWTALLGGPSYEVGLARRVSDYWTRFADRGDPNLSGNASWPAYAEQVDPEIVLDLDIHEQQGHRIDKCKLWTDVRAAVWGEPWAIN